MSSQIPPNNGIVQTPQAVVVNPPIIPEEISTPANPIPQSEIKAFDPGDEWNETRMQMETVEDEYAGLEVNDYTVAP